MTGFASLLLLGLLRPSALPAVPAEDFEWRGALERGKVIEVSGVRGSIEAAPAPDGTIVVTAVKRGKRSDPEEVVFKVVEHGEGVTICAVYPSPRRGPENDCRPGGGRNNTDNTDVEVTWTVRVPSGVRFMGRTVNGGVTARGLDADVEVYAVNGDLLISTSGWASGSTVNGAIEARLATTAWSGNADFETVNGDITIELPREPSVEVDATTVNGSMSTDFPLSIRTRMGSRRLRGTMGEGGRILSLTSVNGDLRLRKGSGPLPPG
jgi:hypothetical protein